MKSHIRKDDPDYEALYGLWKREGGRTLTHDGGVYRAINDNDGIYFVLVRPANSLDQMYGSQSWPRFDHEKKTGPF